MKINDLVNENREKPIGLLSGYLFFILILIPFKALLPETSTITYLIIIAGIEVIWTFAWLIIRTTYPKNKKNKIGIVISINSEDDKQKIRIKNDFLRRLKKQASQNDIDAIINFIYIGSTKTQRVNSILYNYVQNGRYRSSNPESIKSIKAFDKLKNKIKGHFYIWGDIKQRMDGENKYFLELEGLVLHSPLNDPIKTKLSSEFRIVWARSINFLEKIEFKGFLISADFIFIGIDYILGLAAYFTGDIILSEKLHSRLELNIPNEIAEFPNIRHIKKSLSELIPIELNLCAVIETNKGNYPAAEEYLKKSFQRNPENNYSALIAYSVIQFVSKKDPIGSLNTIRKAKKCPNTDGTWRYNEAFLLMYTFQFPEALALYKDIAATNYPNEERVLAEVLEFNKSMITQNPEFYQSYYILGCLYYKKTGNIPEAYNYFDQFLTKCTDPRFQVLIDLANKYIKQLSQRMELKL